MLKYIIFIRTTNTNYIMPNQLHAKTIMLSSVSIKADSWGYSKDEQDTTSLCEVVHPVEQKREWNFAGIFS